MDRSRRHRDFYVSLAVKLKNYTIKKSEKGIENLNLISEFRIILVQIHAAYVSYALVSVKDEKSHVLFSSTLNV